MRWPWRRRRAVATKPAPRHRATWATAAAPPPATTPTLATTTTTPRSGSAASAGSVLLGFADGTQAELPHGNPNAVALRAVADVLMRGEPLA
jgi:hypothetical protein